MGKRTLIGFSLALPALAVCLAPTVAFAKKNQFRKHNALVTPSAENKWENAGPVEVVDMDGDGDMDIVYGTEHSSARGRIVWLENKRKGKKWKKHEVPDSVISPRSLYVLDFDNDGDLDIVAHGLNGGPNWYENKKKGKKWAAHKMVKKKFQGSIAIGDVDGDGDNDLVASKSYPGQEIRWYENTDGKGAFSDPKTLVENTSPPLVVANVDDDAQMEIVVDMGAYTVFKYDGSEWQKTAIDLGVSSQGRRGSSRGNFMKAVDVDGDSDTDILVTNANVGIGVLVNEGGSFKLLEVDTVKYRTHGAAAADFDGDGDTDVIGRRNDGVFLYRNEGNGKWSDEITIAKGWASRSLAAGDLDGDGDLDVLCSSHGLDAPNMFAWWVNSAGKGKKKKKKK